MPDKSPLHWEPPETPVLNYALPKYPCQPEITARASKVGVVGRIVDGIIVLGTVAFLAWMLTPNLGPHPFPLKTKCLADLRMVNQIVLQYAADNKGHFPDDLGELVIANPTFRLEQHLICPESSDTPAVRRPSGSVWRSESSP